MRLHSTHVLIALAIALVVVGISLAAVSIGLSRDAAERTLLSREAVAIVDEAIAAWPESEIEVRARTSVTKGQGRRTWVQGEFVIEATPSAAAAVQARASALGRPLGLGVVSDGERVEGAQPVRRWSIRSRETPLVQVLVYLRAERPVPAGAPAPEPPPPAATRASEPPPSAVAAGPPPTRLVIRPCPPEVAIIIDDVGYVWSTARAFVQFERPVTLSIFPNLEHSTEIARQARARGREVLMHLPMESHAVRLNPGTLRTDMTEAEIRFQWDAALRTLPGIVGLNNHQGSVMTADADAMERVLGHVLQSRLFFIDSRTTNDSVARATAERMGVPTSENDLFLDNVKDVEYIKQKCRDLLALALVKGSGIGIAHAHPVTLQALQEVLPEYDAAGVRLVYVSALVN